MKNLLLPFAKTAISLLLISSLAACNSSSDDNSVDKDIDEQTITLSAIGSFQTNIFDNSAQEILTFDKTTNTLFVVNGGDQTIDVIDLSDPTQPNRVNQIDLSAYGKQANSVSVHNGVVVAAVENNDKQAPGKAVFFDTNGTFLSQVTVGALPDMVTFTPDGSHVLVANEGEPNDDYTNDPEGSVSVITVGSDAANISQDDVKTAGFNHLSKADLPASVNIYGPGASVAQDMEPEYITVANDSATAWVVLQENNAIAEIDVATGTITQVHGLGYKNHMLENNKLDVSNKDNAINIANWPIFGSYLPDSITSFEQDSKTYLITANEGDSRDYAGFSEEKRVKDLVLDPIAFPDAATLQQDENLGRLKVTTTLGDTDNDGDFDELYSYGARSFSIWNSNGELVFDSGSDFEDITAERFPENFNSTNDENISMDNRSDDKGPEPEAITVGEVNGATYAFIGLERMGGIMVYNISEPEEASFVQYITTRDFTGEATLGTAGDLAPEGFKFISAEDSPTGKPLLAAAYEVSGSTTIFEIN